MNSTPLLALVGSGEYLPVMEDIDRQLLASTSANGSKPRVVCLPTAAGQEGDASVDRWSGMGMAHFTKLGAQVSVARITHRAEAADPRWVEMIAAAHLVYFSGGNPLYLYETLQGTPAWDAVSLSLQRGGVYAGCSAGAMVMGEHLPDFRTLGIRNKSAFGLLKGAMIFPHFDRMLRWRGLTLPILQAKASQGLYVLGIDEDTALVGRPGDAWQVMGRGRVYIITHHQVYEYTDGNTLTLPM